MSLRLSITLLAFLMSCGLCQAKAERWSNFAEDADLKYYVDHRSIVALPDNVYLIWVKSVPKEKEYFKKEYNMNNVSYMFTNYDLDCAVSSYRIRGTIMFDKNRKEISKSIPETEPVFEPVPPESMLELAQDEVCVKEAGAQKHEGAERLMALPAAPLPETAAAPALPEAAATPAPPEAAETAEAPETPARPEAPLAPAAPLVPAAPSSSDEVPALR